MKQISHNLLMFIVCSTLTSFTFVSCMEDAYKAEPGTGETPNPFNFSTTTSIQLDVKYDVPTGYKVLFDVYLENPFITDEDGQIVKRTDVSPVITRMTDANGEYHSKEIITTDHSSEAYIYTSYIGVNGLFKTALKDGAINANITLDTANTRSTTRVATTVPDGYFALSTWNVEGRPNNLDSEGVLELSPSLLRTINKTLEEGGTCDPKYRQSVDFSLNDPKGRKAEVLVRMIGGQSGAASMFGYYCYKENATKAEIQKAKKVVIFPNTITSTAYGKPVSLKGGECVKLHYFDENGMDQGTEFPSGIKIGWFLLNDAFASSGIGYGAFYSTSALNNDGRTHTAAFSISNFIVLSFEDWNDNDYNDVMFNIWSNPIEAIITPNLPVVKPEEGTDDDRTAAYRSTYKGIISFEDCWPNTKDYDLNDVVVKYNSVLAFNTKNEVLSTEDTFTVLWSGATFNNGFSYELNTDRSNVTTTFDPQNNPNVFAEQGLDKDLAKATVNVFVNAIDITGNNTKTPVYQLTNTFKTAISHDVFGIAPYNPFITVHSKLGADRTEVHLVNHKPTLKADEKLFHTGEDLSNLANGTYYVAASSYPFAINLIDATSFSSIEKEKIDKTYPKFIEWVKSNGTKNKDWYK